MTVFYGYILFALTTAIVAVYELVLPIKDMGSDTVREDWYTKVFTFFCMALLMAPVIIFPCLIPSMGDRFKIALLDELEKVNE